jgi:hypothetical protein
MKRTRHLTGEIRDTKPRILDAARTDCSCILICKKRDVG